MSTENGKAWPRVIAVIIALCFVMAAGYVLRPMATFQRPEATPLDR